MKTDTNIVIREVTRYDGQNIFTECDNQKGGDQKKNIVVYEFGSYLGGGAAGVVYEAINSANGDNVAIKILNPIGFKLTPSSSLHRFLVAVQGEALQLHKTAQKNRSTNSLLQVQKRHIWWLVHPSTREVLAAFLDPRFSKLREVPLTVCVRLWGWDADLKPRPPRQAPRGKGPLVVRVRGAEVPIPSVPKKYVKFLTERRSIFREIASMSKIKGHPNCLKLEDVLEFLNDSKSTIFLVLELAQGGELFDRIEIDRGTSEATARHYFAQLLQGLSHCHNKGVCHRDLKPENLLLADNEDDPTLKIADFGLSALFRERELSQEEKASSLSPTGNISDVRGEIAPSTPKTSASAGSNLVRLKSIVGSPHYVAPEILNGNGIGYEGAKADVWSAGVILYAMLAGNLPFGKEILRCPRFNKWKAWTAFSRRIKEFPRGEHEKPEPFPTWFFPQHFSKDAIAVLTGLLEPDAELRMSVEKALRHPWVDPHGKFASQMSASKVSATTTVTGNFADLSIKGPGGSDAPHVDEEGGTGPPTVATIMEGYESAESFKSNVSDRDLAHGHSNASSNVSGVSQLSIDASFTLDSRDVPPGTSTPTAAHGGSGSDAQSPIDLGLDVDDDDDVDTAANALAPQLSTLSLGGAAPRRSEYMAFSSPPLAPRSVREMNSAHGEASGNAANNASMKRVSSLDDFNLDGDRAWMPDEKDASWSTPPSCGLHPGAQTRSRRVQQPSVTQSPVLSFISANGAAQRAIDASELKDLETFLKKSDDFFDPTLPVFHDLVHRSTRFSTNVPAAEVILRIADIVAQDEFPLPAPYTHIRQKVRINKEEYRLDVTRGGIPICTVQIFQLRTGMYIVDFTRGRFGIFAFKRFFEDIRARLQQLIKLDYKRTSRLLDTPTIDGKSLLKATKLTRTVSNQF